MAVAYANFAVTLLPWIREGYEREYLKPQSAKAKGRSFQQKVRDMLLAAFLNLEPDDVKSTSMGAQGEDVQLSPAARKVFPYQIECKAKARAQVYTWYEQAQTHGSHQPVVFIKQDRKAPLAIVDAEHFIGLTKELNEYRTKNSE